MPELDESLAVLDSKTRGSPVKTNTLLRNSSDKIARNQSFESLPTSPKKKRPTPAADFQDLSFLRNDETNPLFSTVEEGLNFVEKIFVEIFFFS